MDAIKQANLYTGAYYAEKFSEHGDSVLALDWKKGKQFERFHQLTSDWDMQGSSILDVGCGFGDFNKYLKAIGVNAYRYTGIDLVEGMINAAKDKYPIFSTNTPESSTVFLCADVLDMPDSATFNYAISSGIFNIKHNAVDMYEHLRVTLKKMWEMSDTAIAVDMLSDKVDFAYEHTNNYSPSRVLDIGYMFSRRVVLKNDYFPFEFSLIIYKDESFPKETTMFNEAAKAFGKFMQK
jgi:ubiquinone/menaquinone biosynthesis C-methylase UbiE